MHGSRHRLVALALAALVGSVARAETPEIEIYVGTRKVAPLPKPSSDPTAGPRAVASVAHALQSATGSALDSAGKVMTRMLERAVPKFELPHVPVVVNVTLPPPAAPAPSPIVAAGGFHQTGFAGSSGAVAPGLLPWVNANSPRELTPVRSEPREEPKPTVIVVREAAPMLPQDTTGIKLSTEHLLAIAACFGIALVFTVLAIAWRAPRSARSAPATIREGHLVVGGRDAGPLFATAEKFELGPTFAEQRVQEQAATQAGETAMLQFILDQNLVLRAELADG